MKNLAASISYALPHSAPLSYLVIPLGLSSWLRMDTDGILILSAAYADSALFTLIVGLLTAASFVYYRKTTAHLHHSDMMRDRTETKVMESQQKHLSDLTKVLNTSLNRDETLKALGSFCATHLCDWCSVYVFETSEVKRIGTFHSDPAQQGLADELAATELPPALEKVILTAVSTRRSQLRQNIQSIEVQNAVKDNHVARLYAQLGIQSFIVLPLTREHQVLAVMTAIKTHSNFENSDLGFFEDIADRASTALRNARLYQMALSAIKQREEMVAVVSHDLNSPLSAIQMGADMVARHLERHAEVDETQEIRKRIDGIKHSVGLAIQLTNNILDAAKIDSGNLFVDRRPLDPALPVQNAEKLLVQLAESKQIQVDICIQCDKTINADLDRLNQVFANLIGNALKFTPRRGQISIGVKSRDEGALFYVADTGVGIHKDYLPHLFDMYWQAQKSASKSLGLGLAIAHGIIEAHGGKIWAENNRGKGSIFYFTIPFSSINS